MQKIIIVGIGQGGIVAAEKLAKLDYDIEVFEQRQKDELTYDWHDDVAKSIFARADIPLPDSEHYFEKKDWTFYAACSNIPFRINQDKDKLDYSMERRPFINMLIDRVPKKVKIHYGAKVEGLYIEDEKVKGIIYNGKKIEADLVIDSSGAKSVLRRNLPYTYRIQAQAAVGELFYAYRAFYEGNKVEQEDIDTNKVYLKHLGEKGISWCIKDPSGQVNVLVGRIGVLNEYDIKKSLADLRKNNPVMGDKVVRGGIVSCIPVRRPLCRMVGEGYLAIGDAAFMTIPMLGSGIASSTLAATLLYEVLSDNPSLSVDNLWRYQVAFYRECGAKNCAVDVLKRWILNAPNKDIRFLFDKRVLNSEDMKRASIGELVVIDVKSIKQKIKVGYKRLDLLIRVGFAAFRAQCAYKRALRIPKEFNRRKIINWERQLNMYFKNPKVEESPV